MARLTALPPPSARHERMRAFVEEMQGRLVKEIEAIDGGRFRAETWERPEGGGGTMMVLRGDVVEKGGVNVSAVHGATNPLTGNPFRATGLSLILHPRNPHAPTVHLNVRYFEESGGRAWYGGGMDLTPMGFPYAEDTRRFHEVCRDAVESAGFSYPEAAARADQYFHVKHRGRPRGVGGVFYDEVAADDRGEALVRALARRFQDAYLPILRARKDQPSTEEERAVQLRARGVYVEFNLLYDKGTRFGFESGGNPDAILVSLPPHAAW